MKKLSVKDLIEFRRKSDKSKKTFVENIKSNKIVPPAEGGRDYWTTGLSAVCNSFRTGNTDHVDDKIDELLEKIANTPHTISKNMYLRNIEILQTYKKMDWKTFRPTDEILFLKKSSGNRLLTIKGLEVETKPSHIYMFGKKGEEKVGAFWFIAKKDGYRNEEIGMFCEMLYRFLRHNYSKKFEVSLNHCVAADMTTGRIVDYATIERGELPQNLTPTLEAINALM